MRLCDLLATVASNGTTVACYCTTVPVKSTTVDGYCMTITGDSTTKRNTLLAKYQHTTHSGYNCRDNT